MVCLYCSSETQVVNSRLQKRLNRTWRRRKCKSCGGLFTTTETAASDMALRVLKPAGLESFDRDKLFLSIYESCRHRPAGLKESSDLTDTIIAKLTAYIKHASVEASQINSVSAQVLKNFDQAAFIHYQAYHPAQ